MSMLEIGTTFHYGWTEDGPEDEDGWPEEINMEAEMTVCGYVHYNQELYYVCLSDTGEEKEISKWQVHNSIGVDDD